DPSPILRGLVSCTGNDYCHMALIETKGWALKVAGELEKRTAGRKLKPLTIHWSGCPAGCGLHQVATIGLQGCRSRVNGEVVDAAHVYVNGKAGPQPVLATDLMYDGPCERLADALEPLGSYLPRSEARPSAVPDVTCSLPTPALCTAATPPSATGPGPSPASRRPRRQSRRGFP